MDYVFETERLRLRELRFDDAAFIIELVNSPGWLKFIGDRNIKTMEQAKVYLETGPIKSYRENGFGLWLVETKEKEIPIGMCGLLRRDYLDDPDIGFAFLPEFIGRGFAAEAAVATLRFAKNELHIPALCAITLPTNIHSIRLLEKIGLRLIKPFCVAGSTTELLLYRLIFSGKKISNN